MTAPSALRGAAAGMGYGMVAEYWRPATIAAGALIGLATAALVEEAAVPLSGPGDAPWKAPASTHAHSAASRLVDATLAEATR